MEEAWQAIPSSYAILVSTVDEQGRENVAPAARFVKICDEPKIVGVCISKGHDTYANIKKTKEFVIAVPDASLARKVWITGKPFSKGMSEFEKAGLQKGKAWKIKPFLVAECALNLECTLKKALSLGDHDLFVGEVAAIHYDGKIDSLKSHQERKQFINPIFPLGDSWFKDGKGKVVDTKIDYKRI